MLEARTLIYVTGIQTEIGSYPGTHTGVGLSIYFWDLGFLTAGLPNHIYKRESTSH